MEKEINVKVISDTARRCGSVVEAEGDELRLAATWSVGEITGRIAIDYALPDRDYEQLVADYANGRD